MSRDIPKRDGEYRGETRERKGWVARLLTFVSPGLGYMYVGKFGRGVATNVIFVLLLVGFVTLFSVLRFFPLLPLLVFAVGWLLACGVVASDVTDHIDALEAANRDYTLESFNHWTVYSGSFLLTYVLPLAAVVIFANSFLWKLEVVDSAAMYPTVHAGDTILIERNGYHDTQPEHGDLVAVWADTDRRLEVLRTVAVPGDTVRIEGNTVYVNDRPMRHAPLQKDQILNGALGEGELLAWVEQNAEERYVITLSKRTFSGLEMGPTQLETDEFFLLADNRNKVPRGEENGEIRDSRNFGSVDGEMIGGRPLFVAWSRSPESGEVRWERIGLRLR